MYPEWLQLSEAMAWPGRRPPPVVAAWNELRGQDRLRALGYLCVAHDPARVRRNALAGLLEYEGEDPGLAAEAVLREACEGAAVAPAPPAERLAAMELLREALVGRLARYSPELPLAQWVDRVRALDLAALLDA